jgi:hypothetical protein
VWITEWTPRKKTILTSPLEAETTRIRGEDRLGSFEEDKNAQ